MDKFTVKAEFCAGAGRADITPPVGTLLYGYNPHQESTSVHDNLDVTVLALGEGEETVLLITITVGDIQTELCRELCEVLHNAYAIPTEKILISATHTHSAPNVSGMEGWGEMDAAFIQSLLIPGIIKATRQALDAMVPAQVAYGTTHSKVGVNRRQLTESGNIIFGQNPWGTFDDTMRVIIFRSKEDKHGIFNLIHYGCHGTAAGCNQEISRDWPGIMCDCLEKETGVLTAFWNGTVGDVGPRLTNGKTVGDIGYVEALGAVAAADAFCAYQNHGGFEDGTLRCFTDCYQLPYKPLPSLGEVIAELEKTEHPEQLINIERLSYYHYKQVREFLLQKKKTAPEAMKLPVTAVSIGKALFVPLPFEVFSGISLRLGEYLKDRYPYVCVLSNTGGYYGYLPTQDQLCLGGYEVDCFLHTGLFLLADNTDQQVVSQTIQLIKTGKID